MSNDMLKKDLGNIQQILHHSGISTSFISAEKMGGMTNRSYHLTMENGEDLVVRLPGEGTEVMISRTNEKISTELACELGIDSELLYFGEDGSKITRYIKNAVTMTADHLREKQHIMDVADIFHKLHNCGIDTKVPFEIFEMAHNYENIILKHKVKLYDDYNNCKETVMQIKNSVDSFGISTKVPCHNDPLCENWVYGNNKMYLVDWEYAGMNDGMWDLADVSIEAAYNDQQDDFLLNCYLARDPEKFERKRFIANKIYLDYLWTLWGLTRVPFDGQVMQEYADDRYVRLKQNINQYKIRD